MTGIIVTGAHFAVGASKLSCSSFAKTLEGDTENDENEESFLIRKESKC